MRVLILSTIIFILCGCSSIEAPQFDPSQQSSKLTVEVEDGATRVVPFQELADLEALPSLTYDDHLLGEERRYIGLNLAHLKQLSGADETFGVLKFHCRDGYVSEVEVEVLEQGQFLLAIRDTDAAPETFLDFDQMTYLQTEPSRLEAKLQDSSLTEEERQALKRRTTHLKTLAKDMQNLRNQGPFYPIFLPSESLAQEKRWSPPFCVEKITFAKSKTDRSLALPDGLAENHPANRGSKLFSNVCSSCHSINGIGGRVGPELNRPLSVTEYWDQAALRQMMRDPAKVRAGSKMPAFHLGDEKIDDILAYLNWMAKNKKRP